MKTHRLWKPHAEHILEAIAHIERYMLSRESDSKMVQDAIFRNLHTLSESADKLPNEIKQHYPNIHWRNIKSFRNHLVHEYLGDQIDFRVVENTIRVHLPELKKAITDILLRFPEGF